jgi:hypothetical protein
MLSGTGRFYVLVHGRYRGSFSYQPIPVDAARIMHHRCVKLLSAPS